MRLNSRKRRIEMEKGEEQALSIKAALRP